MMLARKFAVRITEFVVRRASAGSREWAEGLAREVASIRSDWAALCWALGSLQVLVDRRGAPIGSLAEVPAAAYRLVENLRSGYGMWYILLQGPVFLLRFFWEPTWTQRCGCALIVVGAMVACIRLLVDRRRLNKPWKDDVYDDAMACARFYQEELERLLSTMWVPVASLTCYCVGVLEVQRGGIRAQPIFAAILLLLCIATVLAMLYARRMNLRRLDRLDQLLAGVE